MTMNGQHLRQIGDQLQGTGTSAATALWNAANRIERAEHPSADARVLVGLAARRAVRLLQAVLLTELTRLPQAFSAHVAAFSNGIVREAGERLDTFPYEERLRAFNGLAAELAAGLGLGLAEKAQAPPSSHLPTQRLKAALAPHVAMQSTGLGDDGAIVALHFRTAEEAGAARAAIEAVLSGDA